MQVYLSTWKVSSTLERKVYHNAFLNPKSQNGFDSLRKLNTLDKTEEDNDISWECGKIVKHFKEKELITAQIKSVLCD
jgi:hypothetical protein